MKALSLTQPWAWLVVSLGADGKCIENRVWNTRFRGEFLVHAAKRCTLKDYDNCCAWLRAHVPHVLDRVPMLADLERSGIVGSARVVDIVEPGLQAPLVQREGIDYRWHMVEQYGFVLEERKRLPFIPCSGALGFWNVPADVLALLEPDPVVATLDEGAT